MKKFIFLLAALFICHAASAGTLKSESIQDQGVTRSYYIYLPADLPANAPLVFILHGYGGSAKAYVNNSSLTFKELATHRQLPTHVKKQVGMFTILGRLTR